MAITLRQYAEMDDSAPVGIPINRTASGRAWMCPMGAHRWHCNRPRALQCAWLLWKERLAPMSWRRVNVPIWMGAS